MLRTLLPLVLSLTMAVAAAELRLRPAEWAQPVIGPVENLYRIDEHLYRSAQPDAEGFKALATFGIRNVLNLREYHDDDDEAKGVGLTLHRVAIAAGSLGDNEVIQALRLIRQSPGPVLVHCWHGSDRTGTIVAMYRIVIQGWTREQALDELENGGYGFHANTYPNIPRYLRTVEVEKIRQAVLGPNVRP